MYSAHVQWYAPCSLVTQRQWAAHRETEKCYADSESWRALFRARIWSGLRTWNHSHTVDRPTRRHEDGRTDGNTPHAGSHHCGGAMDGSATRSTLAACKADTSLAISTGHIMCFYEKVIKVKADVAALLNLFSDVSIDLRWGF